jgi:hypothetical protein
MVRDVGEGDPALLAFAGAKVMNRETRATNQQLADWIREVRGVSPKQKERQEGLEQPPAEQQPQDGQDVPHPQGNENVE